MTFLEEHVAPEVAPAPRRGQRAVVTAWAAAAILTLGGWGAHAVLDGVQHYSYGPGPTLLTSPYAFGPVFSPDGSHIRFTVRDMKNRLSVRELALAGDRAGDPAVLAPGPRAWNADTAVAFSPDGSRIAYVDEAEPGGRDDRDGGGRGLYVANADGSGLARVAAVADPFQRDEDPEDPFGVTFSPDGTRILFASAPGPDKPERELVVMGVDGSGARTLTTSEGAREYDAEHSPAFSPDGRSIAYVLTVGSGRRSLWVMNADGTGKRKLPVTGGYGHFDPAFSPDGKRIAFAVGGNAGADGTARNGGIAVMNADGTGYRRLTTATGDWTADFQPAWSPDGKRIAFVSDRTGMREIFVVNADGTGLDQLTHFADPEVAR